MIDYLNEANKPYSEKRNGNIIKRTFSQNVDENELLWHRDKEDRYIEVLNESDWSFQMDNEIPVKLTKGFKIFIPKEAFHRVIKGKTDLDILIKEGELEEEKKKRDRCLRKADSVYGKETSAYKSGAVVKCRQGKIWKLKENKSDKKDCLKELSKKLINQAHTNITRKKGKDYAPDFHELQAWIDEYIENNGGKEKVIEDNCGKGKISLNEISSGDAYNKFYQGLFDKDNKENDKTLFAKYIELDPTFKKENDKIGEYTKWLFRKDNLEKLKKTKEEDLFKIKDDLYLFNNLKSKNLIPKDKKDINKFNLTSLLDFVFDKQTGSEDLLSKKEKGLKKDVIKYDLTDWTIIIPKTEAASCFYGKGTKWCTASDNDNRFNYYSENGDLYILINKETPSEKYQFHFESNQFMDVKDRNISLNDFFSENDEVYEFFNKIKSNLDFIICREAISHYNIDGFDDYYSNKFDNEEKYELLNTAFQLDDSDYYMVSHVLNYVYYEGIGKDFKSELLYGLTNSLENKYDKENYKAKMFIDYLGGFNETTIDDIINAVNFKNGDEVEKIINIAQEYDAIQLLLNSLDYEGINLNFDMLDTLSYLKQKFYNDNKSIESNLAKVIINKIDMENETLNIEFIPKNKDGKLMTNKKESGNIDYKNLYKYLTNPQLFESEKNIKRLEEKWSEKYKRSIDCNNPKGFSQKAHCQGRNKTNEANEKFQNKALEKINKVGGFEMLPDIDKLALLGGTDDKRLMFLDLEKIFKENGGTFGMLEIKVKIKDANKQPIKHEFSQEFAGKEGYLFPYIHYSDDDKPYVTVRFDEFVSNLDNFGGGNYEERPIMLANMYPIDYDEIKTDFVKYQNKVDFERGEFGKYLGGDLVEGKKTDFSK